MRVRVELGLHLLGLRVAVVLLGIGAVALFDRMSPAIERILAENVVTLEATEQMLTALADPALEPEQAREMFEAGLKLAEDNVTEPAEEPLLTSIRGLAPRAFERDPDGARARLVDKVVALAQVNRSSMQSEDEEARRLGLAGGWAVVLVAVIILGITMLLTRRLESRVVSPLVNLAAQVERIRGGDVYLRCTEDGAPELREVTRLLNQLLDGQNQPRPPQRLARADRKLVLYLLDRRPGAWLVTDEEGELLACNREAMLRIEREGHPAPEAMRALREEPEAESIDGELWLVRWPT